MSYLTAQEKLQFFLSAPSPCAYYNEKVSTNIITDPEQTLTMPLYSQLISHGFRRSGADSYRPHCGQCQRCISCRLIVNQFTPSRSQKRCTRKNINLKLKQVPAHFTEEYLLLYQRYLKSRHREGTMAQSSADDFKNFLYCDWSHTLFLELRLNDKLVALAVTDIVDDGLSAVYSFFEPTLKDASLGTYCIIQQINYAKSLGLQYLYLGYWINQHPKMHYKTRFSPLEMYQNNQWEIKQ